MKTVKVGSVGLGRLGYEHAKNLATQVPGCELAAICDVDANRVKEVAAELGVPNTYTDFEEMCKNPELDATTVSTCSARSRSARMLHSARLPRRSSRHILT